MPTYQPRRGDLGAVLSESGEQDWEQAVSQAQQHILVAKSKSKRMVRWAQVLVVTVFSIGIGLSVLFALLLHQRADRYIHNRIQEECAQRANDFQSRLARLHSVGSALSTVFTISRDWEPSSAFNNGNATSELIESAIWSLQHLSGMGSTLGIGFAGQ